MYLDAKFGGHKETSEYFQTAGRSIKTGLISGDRALTTARWTKRLHVSHACDAMPSLSAGVDPVALAAVSPD